MSSLTKTLTTFYAEGRRLGAALNDIPGVDSYPDDPDVVEATFKPADAFSSNRAVSISVRPDFLEYGKEYTAIRPEQVHTGSVRRRFEVAEFDLSAGPENARFSYHNAQDRVALDPESPRQNLDLSQAGPNFSNSASGVINLVTGTITQMDQVAERDLPALSGG